MELQREYPPAYHAHDPNDVKLPSVPQHEPLQTSPKPDVRLPDLRSVLAAEFDQPAIYPNNAASSPFTRSGSSASRSLPRIDSSHIPTNGYRTSMESAVFSPSEAGSVMSMEEHGQRSTSIASLDDPDVRIAAEALSGLGNPGKSTCPHCVKESHSYRPDFARASPRTNDHMPSYVNGLHAKSPQQEAEPLLELLAQAHPWVGGTINGSMSAYSGAKYYSPRFVQYGANLVERNVGMPVVSTVSSVGRMTGVENGIRRYLGGGRRPSDLERSDSPGSKRRRVMEDEMDLENGHASPTSGLRRDSQESRSEYLPAYRSSKPPSYREEASPTAHDRTRNRERPPHNRSWSTQIASNTFVTVSGLGIALHENSRRSLRFCLSLLGKAAESVETTMNALSMLLREYDQARQTYHQDHHSSMEKGETRERTPDHDDAARRLADLIKQRSDEIWQTLKAVVNSVSTYAGGALPENAQSMVRTQLMSLPQRWRVTSDGQHGESETSRSAHRMIAFATEGLDMMSQVSQIVKATLDSAEKWLQRNPLGRRRVENEPTANGEKDVEMMEPEHE